jgi:AcrR family transcriptional regulator
MTEILSTLPATPVEESASTHERLLSCAAALFAERGYGGTSMADIAGQVGVRKASLYNYYPSKEEILMELLRRGLEAGAAACLPPLDAEALFAERLWRHFRATVRFAAEQPELVAIFRLVATRIGGDLGERAAAMVNAQRLRQRRRLEAFFAEAVAAGAVADADPEDLSYVFRAFTHGVLVNHLGACEIDERLDDARLERVWKLFWRGIAGGEG